MIKAGGNVLRRGTLTVSVLSALGSVAPGTVLADAWILQPQVSISQKYDDNFRLSQDNKEQVWTTQLSGTLGISRITETTRVTGRIQLNFKKHTGDTDRLDDLNSQYLFLDTSRKWERLTTGLNVSYRRDDTLADRFDAPDAGQTVDQTRRTRFEIAPTASYALSERNSVDLDFRYQDVTYDDARLFGLIDYRTWRLDGGFRHRLSETSSAKVSLGVFDYSANDDNRKYDTNFVLLEYDKSITEILRAGVTVGWRKTDFDLPLQSGSNSGYVAELRGSYSTEVDRFSGKIGRTITPTGGGNIAQRDGLQLTWDRSLSSKWSASLRARYFKDKTLKTVVVGARRDNREYLYLSPAVRWRFAREWTLEGAYVYQRRKRDSESDAADGNSFFLSLSYVIPVAVDSFFNEFQ